MPAGMAGEVKACVNVLNIVGKRHLQLPRWHVVKTEGEGLEVRGATLRGQTHAANCSACKSCNYIMYKWELYHKGSVDLVYLQLLQLSDHSRAEFIS